MGVVNGFIIGVDGIPLDDDGMPVDIIEPEQIGMVN